MSLKIDKIIVLKVDGKFAKGSIKKPDFQRSGIPMYGFNPDKESMKSKLKSDMDSNDLAEYIKELDEIRNLVDAYNIADVLEGEENGKETP